MFSSSSYEHLTQLLIRLMDECPNNAVDVIEELSLDVKRALFIGMQSTLRDFPQCSSAELLSEQQHTLFSLPDEVVHEEDMVLDLNAHSNITYFNL